MEVITCFNTALKSGEAFFRVFLCFECIEWRYDTSSDAVLKTVFDTVIKSDVNISTTLCVSEIKLDKH